jgi:uncharacterized protein YjbI with pentapeptide repeats
LEASLEGANLSGANFRAVSLANANLRGANLNNSNLRFADLREANLRQTNLEFADMRSANLQGGNLEAADLSGAYITGANLRQVNLADALFGGTTLISITPVEFPGDLSYRDFYEELVSFDCRDGTFFLEDNGALVPSMIDLAIDQGRRFYNSGEWRNVVLYLCTADFSEVMTRSNYPLNLSFVGVSLRNADLRLTDFSDSTFEEYIQVEGLSPFLLEADLTGINYDEFTEWPYGFTPPPSTRRTEISP